MISRDDVCREVLDSANEDYTGLYAIIWSLNTTHPACDLGEKYTAAGAAVRDLLSRGWIALYLREEGTSDPRSDYRAIEPERVEAVLANPVSWYPEYGGASVFFTATSEGERAWGEGAFRSGSQPAKNSQPAAS